MPATFEPKLDILPESERRLWSELDAVPSDFVLYGGAGFALQLGHGVSEDFDFFLVFRIRSKSSAFAIAFFSRPGSVEHRSLGCIASAITWKHSWNEAG